MTSLHHLILSVCSATPRREMWLWSAARARQTRANVGVGRLVTVPEVTEALKHLRNLGHLTATKGGHSLSASGEEQLNKLGVWQP